MSVIKIKKRGESDDSFEIYVDGERATHVLNVHFDFVPQGDGHIFNLTIIGWALKDGYPYENAKGTGPVKRIDTYRVEKLIIEP
jgi:hypothetical protein